MDTRARADGTPEAHGDPSTPSAPSIPHQPALDGLRGVAVIAVLLYHGGATWMRGGFLGVDLFFVLSGFLITTLLLAEWGRHGRIDLRGFWIRRARRLLPALALVLLGIAVYALAIAKASQLERIRDDGLAAIGYVANWRFVLSDQSYFEQFAAPSPFRHMWSLAIEEQFYLLWPFLVLVLLRWRPQLRLVTRVFVIGAVVSALLMAALYKSGSDPSRVYYGTDTRAQALLAGAVLAAVLLRQRTRRRRAPRAAPWVRAGLAGSVVLLVMLIVTRDTAEWMYRGGYLLAAVACALVIGAAVQPRRNLVRSALSPKPLRAVGKVSYGLYLWHWPVYLTLTEDRSGLHGTALLILRIAVSAGLAAASYFFVEMPVRRGDWPQLARRAVVVVPGLAAVLAAVFLLVPVVRGTPDEIAVASPPVTTLPGTPAPVPARVLVVGDSVAKTLGDGFDRGSHAAGVELFNRGELACGLAQRAVIEHGGRSAPTETTCDDWPAQWEGFVSETAPVVSVVVFDVFVVQDLEVDGESLPFGSKKSDRYLLAQLERGVDTLRAHGGKVVLLTAPYNHRPEVVGQPSKWDEDDPARIDHWNALLTRFVRQRADAGVTLVDLNAYVSPDGVYTNTLNGVELRYDGVHFNPDAAELIFQWVLPQLPAS
ncbi:MAG: acyltransferase family protein [Acidimicrobiia bacterium]